MGKSFSTGPTGSNRIGIDAQHELRYWRQELGCSEDHCATLSRSSARKRRTCDATSSGSR